MLEPAELERILPVGADCLHGRQTIECVTDPSIGCDARGAARPASNRELAGGGRRDCPGPPIDAPRPPCATRWRVRFLG
jgi:hypothetical protein